MADAEAPLTILYFAWLRERVGHVGGERRRRRVSATVGELIAWLAERSPGHAERVRQSADGALRGEPGFRRPCRAGASGR